MSAPRFIRLPYFWPMACALVALHASETPLGGLRWNAAAAATVATPALKVQQVYGKVEMKRGNVWRPLTAAQSVNSAIRTGAGQAELRTDAGLLLLDVASNVTIYKGEFQTAQGKFYAEGPIKMRLGPYHLSAPQGAAFRIDTVGRQHRLAVIKGKVQIAFGSSLKNVSSGQQLNLKTGLVTSFQELDPWYQSRFVGRGAAQLEALRGQVRVGPLGALRPASVGHKLTAGEAIVTGPNSWAELGFSAGGYLRLQAESALKVLQIDQTTKGQQVWLQLTQGSAWNVLEPNSGGYRITTPVVSTAVRGTVYRVDAEGLVKVFQGSVGTDKARVDQGQQLSAAANVPEPLVLSELDLMNMSLDNLRAQPIDMQIRGWDSLTDQQLWELLAGSPATGLEVQAAPLSEVQLLLQPMQPTNATSPADKDNAKAYAWAMQPTVPAWIAPSGELYRPGRRTYRLPAASQVVLRHLPAGSYRLTVIATRYGRQEQQERILTITAPPTPPQGQQQRPMQGVQP